MITIQKFQQHVKGFMQSKLSKQDLTANFAMGLAGEAGEVVDLIKKHLYHGDPLDKTKLIKEMGDVVWYWFALLELFEISPEEVMEANIKKLQSRHGGTTFDRENQRLSKQHEAGE